MSSIITLTDRQKERMLSVLERGGAHDVLFTEGHFHAVVYCAIDRLRYSWPVFDSTHEVGDFGVQWNELIAYLEAGFRLIANGFTSAPVVFMSAIYIPSEEETLAHLILPIVHRGDVQFMLDAYENAVAEEEREALEATVVRSVRLGDLEVTYG